MTFRCDDCKAEFKSQSSLRKHVYRSARSKETCAQRQKTREQQIKKEKIISQLTPGELIAAIENKECTKAILEKMSDQLEHQNRKLEHQNDKIDYQNSKIDSLVTQNNELKDMMIDLQNNPKLLVVCNNLYPLEQLDLKEPKFGPVLEILDKELPEYPNLGNDKTGKVHAKAIKTLNSIQLTAIKDGQEVYFKSENVLAKDKCHKTTKAFIDAIGKMGYEYANKACSDLESTRDSDSTFKDQIISNASIDALPSIVDLQ